MIDIRDEFNPPLKLRQMGNAFTEPDLSKVDPLPRCCCCGREIWGMPSDVDAAYCRDCPCKDGQGALGI